VLNRRPFLIVKTYVLPSCEILGNPARHGYERGQEPLHLRQIARQSREAFVTAQPTL
jgi:hypothetical protein